MNHAHHVYRDRRDAVLKKMREHAGGGVALGVEHGLRRLCNRGDGEPRHRGGDERIAPSNGERKRGKQRTGQRSARGHAGLLD